MSITSDCDSYFVDLKLSHQNRNKIIRRLLGNYHGLEVRLLHDRPLHELRQLRADFHFAVTGLHLSFFDFVQFYGGKLG